MCVCVCVCVCVERGLTVQKQSSPVWLKPCIEQFPPTNANVCSPSPRRPTTITFAPSGNWTERESLHYVHMYMYIHTMYMYVVHGNMYACACNKTCVNISHCRYALRAKLPTHNILGCTLVSAMPSKCDIQFHAPSTILICTSVSLYLVWHT